MISQNIFILLSTVAVVGRIALVVRMSDSS